MSERDTNTLPQRRVIRIVVEIVMTALGVALIAFALGARQEWFDQHFLPVFFLSHEAYMRGEQLARIAFVIVGASFVLLLRPHLGHLVAREPVRMLLADFARVLLAVVLAFGTSEVILRYTFARASEEAPANEEPLRHADSELGWTFVPSRVGHVIENGRPIDYAFDPAGYRVRAVGETIDPAQPTILFTGESIVTGFALPWEESFPAEVGKALGVQSANMSVFGYASDQAYLRVSKELPKFSRPVAVVSLFMPNLLFRNFDDDRPHLGPGLILQPAVHRWRLGALVKWLVPYHSRAEIERCITLTRSILFATADAARSRGAIPLIVVPQFGPEGLVEAMLRKRILDDAGLDYVLVPIDPSWRIANDPHPDARANRVIAAAIVARLRANLQH